MRNGCPLRYASCERSRKYLYPFSGKPDISLSASDEKIEILRKRYKNLNDAQREYMITSTYFLQCAS